MCVYTHTMKWFSSVQSVSRFWLFVTPMDCCTPGLPVHHQFPEFTQTHVHWVGDAIQPSHPLSSPSPPTFNLSQHQDLFQWVDLWPIQYCFLWHQTLLPSPVTSTTGRWFSLWLCLFILSGVTSPVFSSSILGTYWPGEFILLCHIFLPPHTVHGVLKTGILKWFVIPFSSGPHFVRTLHHDPSVLGTPTWHGS